MKKIILYIGCALLCASLTGAGYAQTSKTKDTKMYQNSPRSIADPSLSKRLQTDLSSRESRLGTRSVSWYDAGYGYYGTYSIDTMNYMVRYDTNGKYVETLTQRKWNNTVPSSVRTSFSQSPFSTQQVTSYWEVSSPNGRTGYYIETLDNEGRISRIWADDRGTFNAAPLPGRSTR